jgi:hypothetical protein
MFVTTIDDAYVPFGSGLPRSPGLHLTDIIISLRNALGLGKVAEGWEMSVCADLGFLWEDAFSIAYRDKAEDLIRPGELTVDGILCSPDGFGPDPLGKEIFINHEYKCTWRSFNKSPTDDFYWMTQFKCYCHALSVSMKLDIHVTCLHTMYVVGNYRGSGPKPSHMIFDFDREEINTAWNMVVRHAKEKGWLGNGE